MTSGVKSYPHTGKTGQPHAQLARPRSRSSFNVSVPGSGNYETAYDIWANNNAYEVMLWTNQNGAVGPIAESYDANGAVPAFRNVSVGGHTWNVYRGINGANAVFSFLRTGNTNSGTIDVLAVLNWLRTQGWWGDVTVGDVQFGFEISGDQRQPASPTTASTSRTADGCPGARSARAGTGRAPGVFPPASGARLPRARRRGAFGPPDPAAGRRNRVSLLA